MISWPGGASASDAVDPSGAMLVPAPKVAKKASGLPRQPPSSAGGARRRTRRSTARATVLSAWCPILGFVSHAILFRI